MGTKNNGYKQSLGQELISLLKNNIREYMMYIVLVAIIVFFAIQTDGAFVSAYSVSVLFNQSAYVAVLAIGMTIILILKHIDLSVGYVAGFCGAAAAIMLTNWHWPVYAVIPIIIMLGILIGTYQGLLVTRVGIPAFVVTLAGMFIFRGLLGLATSGNGTIIVSDDFFRGLNNNFIPDIPILDGMHFLTLLIGAIAVVFIIISQIKARRNKQKYNFRVVSTPIFVGALVLVSVAIMGVIYILASYKGIPVSAVIVAAILLIYNFVLNKTKLGRYIYGIGGNDQAAELSGVNVKNVTLISFISMGTLAAIAGILYTSRLKSATPSAGVGFEMDAIASSYIGGVAVSGGVGKVTNTIIGTFIIMSLSYGMDLMGIDTFLQYIVKGIIFIMAVAFDIISRKKRG